MCRHYCDLKDWEQPTITSLGVDGIPPAKVSKESPPADAMHDASPDGLLTSHVDTTSATTSASPTSSSGSQGESKSPDSPAGVLLQMNLI